MKKSSKIILLLSAILISLGLILTIGGLASGVQIERILQDGIWNVTLYEETPENDFSSSGRYSISSADIQQLSVSWLDGSITIEPYDGNEILIEESSSEEINQKNHLGFTTQDGVLRIFECAKTVTVHFFWNQPTLRKDLHLYLPVDLAQSLDCLDLDTADSSINIRGLHMKSLTLDTVDGDITVQDSVIDTLHAETADASLLLQGSQLQTLSWDNLNGDITLAASSVDTLEISTMGGNLLGDLLSCPQSIQFDSLSGNLELQLPADSQFTATWNNFDGAYSSNFQGTYGNGTHTVGDGSAKISMDTMDGRLHIFTQDAPA